MRVKEVRVIKIAGRKLRTVIKIKISNANYGNIDAIAFSSRGTPLGDIIMNHSGSLLHFAGVIKKNDWQGNKAVQFHVRDLFTAQ